MRTIRHNPPPFSLHACCVAVYRSRPLYSAVVTYIRTCRSRNCMYYKLLWTIYEFLWVFSIFWCSVWATCILTKSEVRSCESKSRNFVPSRFPLATWYVFSHVRFDWMQKSWTEIIKVLVNRDNVYRYLWTGPALSYPFSLKVLFYAK